jgi:hypothetical protein
MERREFLLRDCKSMKTLADLMGGTLSVKFFKKREFGYVRNNISVISSHLNPRCEDKTEFL